MKRIGFFLFVLLSIFASSVLVATETPKELTISWTPVGGEENPGKYELGFYEDLSAAPVSSLPLTTSSQSTGTTLTGTGTIYLKWDILSDSDVTIYLKSAALNSTNPADSINWEATITKETSPSSAASVVITGGKFGGLTAETAFYDEVATVFYDVSNGYGDTGAIKLDITTENAASKAPSTYTTTLTAIMKSGV